MLERDKLLYSFMRLVYFNIKIDCHHNTKFMYC